MKPVTISISDLARRSGVAASALRYYEQQGLIRASRSAGGRRQFMRSDLRRVAFIRAAQQVGLSLDDIRTALTTLPQERTPTKRDWEKLAKQWVPLLDARIAELTRMKEKLTSCIGCGCLSLQTCALYNPDDTAAQRGPGARYLLGDTPPS